MWQQGVEGIEKYKRHQQSRTDEPGSERTECVKPGLLACAVNNPAVAPIYRCWQIQRGVFKVLPIIDWHNPNYLSVPAKTWPEISPIMDEGYLSVGDTHTTRKWGTGMAGRRNAFLWLKKGMWVTRRVNIAG
ncbi:phosphoadenosine phosphosulfate reductase family protein [Escherichia coli]